MVWLVLCREIMCRFFFFIFSCLVVSVCRKGGKWFWEGFEAISCFRMRRHNKREDKRSWLKGVTDDAKIIRPSL